MKPRFVAFVAGEGIAIDQLTSRVTVFNMIDHVLLPALPARIVRLTALALYELGDSIETFEERVRFVAPNGDVSAESRTAINLPIRDPGQLPNSHRSIHVLWSPNLSEAGDYRLLLEHKPASSAAWEERASICVTALVQPHPILNAQSPSVSFPSIPVPVDSQATPPATPQK